MTLSDGKETTLPANTISTFIIQLVQSLMIILIPLFSPYLLANQRWKGKDYDIQYSNHGLCDIPSKMASRRAYFQAPLLP